MPGLYAAVFVITRVAGVCSSPVDPWLTNFICAMSPQNICICISNPPYLCLVADIFVKGGKAPAVPIICRLPVNISGTNPVGVNNLVGKLFRVKERRSMSTVITCSQKFFSCRLVGWIPTCSNALQQGWPCNLLSMFISGNFQHGRHTIRSSGTGHHKQQVSCQRLSLYPPILPSKYSKQEKGPDLTKVFNVGDHIPCLGRPHLTTCPTARGSFCKSFCRSFCSVLSQIYTSITVLAWRRQQKYTY